MRRLAVLALVLVPVLSRAESAVTCHCFRDRSFDPALPSAADAYILATTRSSLLSAVFGVSKSALVRAVMTGTSPEDLWIAHWAATRSGRPAAWLLGAVGETGSWRAALAGAEEGLGPEFREALSAGTQPAALAAVAIDDVLRTRLGADAAVLRRLRGDGATSEQVVLAAFLSMRTKRPAPELFASYKAGKATWGTILRDAGLEPQAIDPAVRALVH